MEGLFRSYEEIRRSGLFDAEYYLATYPDVAERSLDPLVHYLEEGAREGRNPSRAFDTAFYLEQCRARGERPDNPLLHYLRVGAARGLEPRLTSAPVAPAPQQPRQAQAAERPPILVAIESLGVLGGPPGTSRVSISGWALADAPIAEIAVSRAGEFTVVARYGLPRPDIARLYPDRPGAGNCGFALAVEMANRGRRSVQPVLSVRTDEGIVAHRAVRVEIPPQELQVPALDPLAADGTAPIGKAPMRLAIDEAAVDPAGVLRVSGWVVSLAQIERIEVLIDGDALGPAAFGMVRPDIENAYPDYPNGRFSGFVLAADIARWAGARRQIAVRAAGRAGIACEAAIDVAVPEIRSVRSAPDIGVACHVEQNEWSADGRVVLKGWAVARAPLEAIGVLLDGKEIGRARLDLDRPEIGNLYPKLPHARASGFEFLGRLPRPAGEHRASLALCCADGTALEQELPLWAEEGKREEGEATVGDADRRLHVDTPETIDGAVPAPVRGSLEVAGWALARAGVAAIEIAIDGVPVAVADYGLRRLDVRETHPDWDGAAASGFTALLPHRLLPKGAHALSVTLRDNTGRSVSTQFRFTAEARGDISGPWSLRRRMMPAEAALGLRILERGGRKPGFVALMPVADEPETLSRARATIASLSAQVHSDWRLVLACGGAATPKGVEELAALDERIAAMPAPSAQTLSAMQQAGAEDKFLTVLMPGDELGVDAFLELALAATADGGADFLYSDERRPDPATGTVEAFFKPGWSPDLLLATNYVGRLWCARLDLLRRIAEAADPVLRHGDYDLVLRCTEKAKGIRHVPSVLCERAQGDTGDGAARDGRALARAAERRRIAGAVGPGLAPGSWRLRRRLDRPGRVSIIVPTCAARGMIETCLDSLRRLTAYRDYEIVCIENIPPGAGKWRNWLRRHADRVISTEEPFNWSRFNNLAAAEASGEHLLFLNDDVEIIDPDWLDALLEEAQRPEIGVVGPRLLYPDGRVQHAGMFLAAMGQARHAFRYAASDDAGYFGLALTRRNVIAVTGACFLIRREIFDALGGFDEKQSIVNNDLDFCLRAWQSGLLNLYTPHATLVHHEAVSRSELPDVYDAASFDRKWRDLFLAGDPYFNPHLSKRHDDFAIDDEPTRLSATGRPVLPRDAIRKVLAIKLDHIGDCVTALPALRRLRQVFPAAHIAVLTAPSSRPVWALEPSIDGTIDYEFFHPRSEFGEHERTEEDWRDLHARLDPERFDLAIDLRKHPETRTVLQHTGARWLAGFDFRNQFPWLDVALEWGGDQIYARKRQHVVDDLVDLVDAVAAACEDERRTIAVEPAADPEVAALVAQLGGSGPLVCVHPASGTAIRQWPVAGFAAVIDRLIEMDAARVLLIGAPGEEGIAEAIRGLVRRPDKITSLVGRLPLTRLPALLTQCALFLGNNSGPKHLAAGLGVPTVGVHDGTVDVREWGPVGPAAAAVARDMACSPCYLSHAEDCRRGVACLRELEPARVYDACKRLLLLRPAAAPVNRGSLQPRARRAARPR